MNHGFGYNIGIAMKGSATTSMFEDVMGSSGGSRRRSSMKSEREKRIVVTRSKSDRYKKQGRSGILSKYTNVMKGWQFRFFNLNFHEGTLEYFEKEEHQEYGRPRAVMLLHGATVDASTEDPLTFSVSSIDKSIIFKLRTFDARERKSWIEDIQTAIQAAKMTQSRKMKVKKPARLMVPPNNITDSESSKPNTPLLMINSAQAIEESRLALEEMQHVMHDLNSAIAKVDNYNRNPNLLMLKAVAEATRHSLEKCQSHLDNQVRDTSRHKKHVKHSNKTLNNINQSIRSKTKSMTPDATRRFSSADVTTCRLRQEELAVAAAEEHVIVYKEVNHDDAIEDEREFVDEELGAIGDSKKTVILHILNQVKLGMDLTRVTLPTFILEKRSLLEMFADCMSHPDLFIRISSATTQFDRMFAVFQWYLLSFHSSGRDIAKKPYNPIIGETFHCCWDLNDENGGRSVRLVYIAEQVSHHPPVSAFHFSCPSKKISMTGSIHTKSKFQGLSVSVTLVGSVKIYLEEYDETYSFTLPSAYARSILTVPWVELGDKCTIECDKSKFTANISFLTKPFYGGLLHQINADLRHSDSYQEVLVSCSGQWNRELVFKHRNNTEDVYDLKALRVVHRKRVRPFHCQGSHESRLLWRSVTDALRCNDLEDATHHKEKLEQAQRAGERRRARIGEHFPHRYFKRCAGGEIFEWEKLSEDEAAVCSISNAVL